MDTKTEQYFRDLHELFRSPGWAIFIEDIKASVPNIDSIVSTKDEQDLFFRKGQLAILANILSMEDQVAAAEQDAQGYDDGAAV